MILTHPDLEVSTAVSSYYRNEHVHLFHVKVTERLAAPSHPISFEASVNQQLLPVGQSKMILHVPK